MNDSEKTIYSELKEKVAPVLREMRGLHNFESSDATVPPGAICIEFRRREDYRKEFIGWLVDNGIDHMESNVSLSQRGDDGFSVYFREEDVVFAVQNYSKDILFDAKTVFMLDMDDFAKNHNIEKRFLCETDFKCWFMLEYVLPKKKVDEMIKEVINDIEEIVKSGHYTMDEVVANINDTLCHLWE